MARQKSQFAKWLGPVLDALRALGGSGKPREVCDYVAEHANVPATTLEATLKSGQTRFYNQVHWARQYLVWEGLLDASTHGVWSLTKAGYQTKLEEPAARKIVAKWVKIHAAARKTASSEEPESDDTSEAPETDDTQGAVLLEILKKVTPEGFERICARLLRESGFERVTVPVARGTVVSTASVFSRSIRSSLFACSSSANATRAPFPARRWVTSVTR